METGFGADRTAAKVSIGISGVVLQAKIGNKTLWI
jgi:hypothetical protein